MTNLRSSLPLQTCLSTKLRGIPDPRLIHSETLKNTITTHCALLKYFSIQRPHNHIKQKLLLFENNLPITRPDASPYRRRLRSRSR